MINNSSKILFFVVLLSSTLITVSANSWLGAWMGLEINLLSFIPLMSDNENSLTTEASLKYFLTQALASAVLLFSIIIFMFESNLMNSTSILLAKLMILSSLLMKSGAAPFHFWFPTVMSGLSWSNALILMTWQKMAPMMLVSYIIYSPMLMISAILSVILGSIGGLNQTSLRKLMAYSSINHLGWMLASLTKSESLWFSYFLFYSFLSVTLILFFKMFNLSHMNHLFSLFIHSKTVKFTMFMNLLSLGGLPPFLGFLPKWLVIQSLSSSGQMSLIITLVVMTLITLFFYLRMGFAAFMLNYNEPSWVNKIETNKLTFFIYSLFSFISLSGMFLLTMFYFVL